MESLGCIVGVHNAQRIKCLLDSTKGSFVYGDDTDVKTRRHIAPTIMKNASGDDWLMSVPVSAGSNDGGPLR